MGLSGRAIPFQDGFVLFAKKAASPQQAALYQTDGTQAEPVHRLDLPQGTSDVVSTGPDLHFWKSQSIWRTDLTAAGTAQIANSHSLYDLRSLQRYGSLVVWESAYGRLWWARDGDPTGARSLTSVSGVHPQIFGSYLYFWTGSRLQRLDLQRVANTGAADVEFVTEGASPSSGSKNPLLPLGDGRMLFVGVSPETGAEPWVTDGTPAGTALLRDVYPGPTSGYSLVETYAVGMDRVSVGGGVVFVARDETHGVELWWTDGTADGTHLVRDIWPGGQSSRPQHLTRELDRVYFSADDGKTGRELWIFEP
jgi:ELWxxDGT repeat protein